MNKTKAQRYNKKLSEIIEKGIKDTCCVLCGNKHNRTDGSNVCKECSETIPF